SALASWRQRLEVSPESPSITVNLSLFAAVVGRGIAEDINMGYTAVVLLTALASQMVHGAAPSLPKYISTCKQNDPNLDECFLKSARTTFPNLVNGDAMLKVPVLDPLRIEELRIGEDGSSSIGLDLAFYKVDFIGLKNTDIRSAKFDKERLSFNFEMYIPKLTVVGPYEVSGKILVLPIRGKGQSNIVLENLNTTWALNGKLMGKSPGTQRLQITNAVVDIEPKNMKISLEGLFGGDGTLDEHLPERELAGGLRRAQGWTERSHGTDRDAHRKPDHRIRALRAARAPEIIRRKSLSSAASGIGSSASSPRQQTFEWGNRLAGQLGQKSAIKVIWRTL
ncbi:hypothetical protein J437_LFUL007990, partial [Ladona fulva]